MVSADRLKPFDVSRRKSAHDQFLDAAQLGNQVIDPVDVLNLHGADPRRE